MIGSLKPVIITHTFSVRTEGMFGLYFPALWLIKARITLNPQCICVASERCGNAAAESVCDSNGLKREVMDCSML